jgi:16S rRNA (adenine1518-N6/adenine1519-N6)-dimethyltransferase
LLDASPSLTLPPKAPRDRHHDTDTESEYLARQKVSEGGDLLKDLLKKKEYLSVDRRHEPHPRPRKSLGQNFLRDENISRKIVRAIEPRMSDVILEIGPGKGALTKHLVHGVRKLVAVEADERMTVVLRDAFPGNRMEVRHEDFLRTNLNELYSKYGQRIRVVGNIPYNITSPILFRVLDNRRCISDATLMLQKEVAARIVAAPRTKEYGVLSVFCQIFADVERLFDVRPAAFYPRPDVTSSLVRLTLHDRPRYAVDHEVFFRTMVRSIFGKRRKTLRNCLKYFVEEIGVELPADFGEFDLRRRPEQLSIKELVELSNRMLRVARHVGRI